MKVINRDGVRVKHTKELNSDGSFSYADNVSQADGLNPNDEFSYAFGSKLKGMFKKGKGKSGKTHKERHGIFSKGGLKKFLGGLKAKKGARKLKRLKNKQGQEVHADILPILQMKGTDLVKPMPDGELKIIPPSQVQKGPDGNNYHADDLKVTGEEKAPELMTDPNDPNLKVLAKEIPADQTIDVKAPSENPSTPPVTETYKKSDVLDADGKTLDKTEMSTTTKILIGVGVLAVLGTIIYFATRKNKTTVAK